MTLLAELRILPFWPGGIQGIVCNAIHSRDNGTGDATVIGTIKVAEESDIVVDHPGSWIISHPTRATVGAISPKVATRPRAEVGTQAPILADRVFSPAARIRANWRQ